MVIYESVGWDLPEDYYGYNDESEFEREYLDSFIDGPIYLEEDL